MTTILIIIGMSIATMVPRLVPAFVMEKIQLRPWLNRALLAVPYAALGALIFPGIMKVVPEQPIIGIVGGLVAVLLAYFGLNVVLVVVGAIITVLLLTM
ncbi:AzlD domain-containing protein [Oceanobacillus piezotolerans]|uniref:AzlD domain-containing protein n=1 Tax=Oceanobacillus piezotolerans TaxID=2448030 RepID=UPI00248313EC|nr:AzlD domain-containing protein [Oceanobacillus piezotolerans]